MIASNFGFFKVHVFQYYIEPHYRLKLKHINVKSGNHFAIYTK